MLAIHCPRPEKFHNFKCGEVFCETPTTYCVGCRLCGEKLAFEEFPVHFKQEHLPIENANKDKPSHYVQEERIELQVEPQSSHGNESVIKSENDVNEDNNAEYIATECIPNAQLVQEQPIEFMEVQLPKLKGSKSYNFIPEHNTTDLEHFEETLDIWPQDSGGGSMENDEDHPFSDFSEDHPDQKINMEINDQENELEIKTDDVKFNCTKCSRIYKTKKGLQHHIRTNHAKVCVKGKSKKKLKCEVCGEIFGHENYLRGHMWKHTGYTCNICGKSFTQLGNLQTHKKRHTGVKNFKCQECNHLFYTDHELKAHVMRHTDSLPIICEICGRLFRNTSKLKAHIRRHTGERPAKCQVCGKCFYSIHDLNVHSVTHTTERPFACDVCGSTFQTKKSLRMHTKKIHSAERKHVCHLCKKAFAHAGGLETHIRREHQSP